MLPVSVGLYIVYSLIVIVSTSVWVEGGKVDGMVEKNMSLEIGPKALAKVMVKCAIIACNARIAARCKNCRHIKRVVD